MVILLNKLTAAVLFRVDPGSVSALTRACILIQGPAVVAYLASAICQVFAKNPVQFYAAGFG